MLLEKISLKPLRIAANMKRHNQPPERNTSLQDSLQRWEFLASRAHAASPRPLARTHDTNTKRNRNRFPGWGQLSLLSPQPPIFWDYLSWSDVEIISCDPLWLLSVESGCGHDLLRLSVESSCCQLRLSVEISVVISCSGCQSRWSVGISWQRICCGQLLWRSVVISRRDYLLRAAVESTCREQLARLSIEVMSCGQLRLSVAFFCCDQLLRLSVK